MKVSVSDVNGSHGTVFTLKLKKNGKDSSVLKQLQKLMKDTYGVKKGPVFYIDSITHREDEILLQLVEQRVDLVKVDYRWNQYREDQKYFALVLEGESAKDYQSKHYLCYDCGREVWGVDRDTVIVFDPETKEERIVSIHNKCLEKRKKLIAKQFSQHKKFHFGSVKQGDKQ